ncbi:MAG: lysophospholipid acyltransferase family protein [Candidatus Acidiferrales bacterium]
MRPTVTEWPRMRQTLEYYAAWLLIKGMGLLPRPLARAVGVALVRIAYVFRPSLRRAADLNLRLAFPDWTEVQRIETVKKMLRNIGWMAGDFSQFPKFTREKIERIIALDGHENYIDAMKRGKGVLILTGHMGPWELSSFAHAVYGYSCYFLARPIQNRRVDALVNQYRCLSGCQVIDKNDSARAVLRILHGGGAIGILADQNTSLEEGVFVPFFGVPASSTAGLARIALRTDAAVVPGYAFWDESAKKYRLRFEHAVELIRTSDESADVRSNTAKFMKVIEDFVRAHPDQWIWVHKRWKTRPPGEKPIYPS